METSATLPHFIEQIHSIYTALAELRGCEFWTADKVLYDAVKTALPFVKYLFDYPL